MARRAGQPRKPAALRAVNCGFAGLPKEIAVIRRAARRRNYRTAFDLIRSLLIRDGDPEVVGEISLPRMVGE